MVAGAGTAAAGGGVSVDGRDSGVATEDGASGGTDDVGGAGPGAVSSAGGVGVG